jgi:uncharacterized SAM-binding protein YcdF (DUF218 family)
MLRTRALAARVCCTHRRALHVPAGNYDEGNLPYSLLLQRLQVWLLQQLQCKVLE